MASGRAYKKTGCQARAERCWGRQPWKSLLRKSTRRSTLCWCSARSNAAAPWLSGIRGRPRAIDRPPPLAAAPGRQAGQRAGVPRQLDGRWRHAAAACTRMPTTTLAARDYEVACAARTYVRSVEESMALSTNRFRKAINSASGMGTGGRLLHHIAAFAPDLRNTLLLSGFRPAGTRGRKLLDGPSRCKSADRGWVCELKWPNCRCAPQTPMGANCCAGPAASNGRRNGASSSMASRKRRTRCASASGVNSAGAPPCPCRTRSTNCDLGWDPAQGLMATFKTPSRWFENRS